MSNNVKKEKIEDSLKLKILIDKNNKEPTPKLVTNFFQADASINRYRSNGSLENEKKNCLFTLFARQTKAQLGGLIKEISHNNQLILQQLTKFS